MASDAEGFRTPPLQFKLSCVSRASQRRLSPAYLPVSIIYVTTTTHLESAWKIYCTVPWAFYCAIVPQPVKILSAFVWNRRLIIALTSVVVHWLEASPSHTGLYVKIRVNVIFTLHLCVWSCIFCWDVLSKFFLYFSSPCVPHMCLVSSLSWVASRAKESVQVWDPLAKFVTSYVFRWAVAAFCQTLKLKDHLFSTDNIHVTTSIFSIRGLTTRQAVGAKELLEVDFVEVLHDPQLRRPIVHTIFTLMCLLLACRG